MLVLSYKSREPEKRKKNNVIIQQRGMSIFKVQRIINNSCTCILLTNITSSFHRSLRAMSVSKTPKVIFILGGPGSGKGTQCLKIQNDFGFKHLSAGDLLREERSRSDSEFGELIDEHIKNGTIVPVEITCKLLERAMLKSNEDTFLIDGFPRNEDNLKGWLKALSDKTVLLCVLVMDCPIDTCINRCLNRGAQGSGRADDNMESIKKRIVTYQQETIPIIDYYRQKDLVRTVDSTRSPEDVHEEIKKIIDEIKNKIELAPH